MVSAAKDMINYAKVIFARIFQVLNMPTTEQYAIRMQSVCNPYAMRTQSSDDPPSTSSIPDLNPLNPLDVNNDGFVSPIDALLVINFINSGADNHVTTKVVSAGVFWMSIGITSSL